MPVTFNSVPQGFAGTYAPPSPNQYNWVGTDGLGTCLGVFVAVAGAGAGNFVGHMDCAVQVTRGPGDPRYEYVRQTASGLLAAALGAFNPNVHSNVNVFSTSPDFSTSAMGDGVADWSGQQPPFTSGIGLRVRYDGTGLTATTWNDTAAAIDGQVGFSVPPMVEPGPVIPPERTAPTGKHHRRNRSGSRSR